MLDIHTHILPGVDDGSCSVAQSIAMLEKQAAQGVTTVALTPHYHASHEAPEDFIVRRRKAENELLSAIQGDPDMPDLLFGAEVAYFDGMCRYDNIDLLCLGDTRAMLVEMPFCKWTQRMLGELEELRQVRGIQPILAHVERYMSFQPSGLIDQLSDNGMLIQVNTSFILRWQTAWKAMAMLKRGCVHFVASDSHDLERRPPNLLEAVEKIEKRLGTLGLERLQKGEERLLGGMK